MIDKDVSRCIIALSIRTGKLTARTLAYALQAAGWKIQKERRAHQTPHSRQSVKQLMSPKDLQTLWKCNDAITKLNVDRLEMQAKLAVDGCRDLYQFWGSRLARQLASETDVVLNLASKEYSKAMEAYLPKTVRFVTCVFGELRDGKVVEKGTKCKMARGQMVRWLSENQIKRPEDLRAFDQLGHQF